MQLKFSNDLVIKIPTGVNAVAYLRKHYGQRYAVEYVQYLERQKAALRAIDAHIEKNSLHL